MTAIVFGRRWRDVHGNTYHTVSIYVDGAHVWKSPVTYGYGTDYLRTARDWLDENGYKGSYIEHETCDVARKGDLK